MENKTTLNDEKSPAEKFKIWKDSYLSTFVLPSEHRDFIEKWSTIFDKVPDDSSRKAAMYGILVENLSGAWGVSMGLENLQRILPAAERLIAKDCFEDALIFFSYFWKYNAGTIEQVQKKKQMRQTESARQGRKAWNKKKGELKALWDYFIEVENTWHPKDSKDHPVRALKRGDRAIEKVFHERYEEIMEVLKEKFPAEKEAFDEFKREFKYYYKLGSLVNNGVSWTGHKIEKRRGRTEKQKKNSRQGALKKKASKK